MRTPITNNAHRQESGSWRTIMIQQSLPIKESNRETNKETIIESNKKPVKKTLTNVTKLLGTLSLAFVTISFVGCGNVENRAATSTGSFSDTSVQTVDVDVTFFRDTVWSNILKTKGCDGCHKRGGSAENIGAFADDSVAHAYNRLRFMNDNGIADASSFVDVDNPAGSRMVIKVAGSPPNIPGHSCWTANCANDAQEIVDQLDAWAVSRATGDVNNNPVTPEPITLVAPPKNNPQGAKAYPATADASFTTTVFPLLTANCSRCHTNTANVPQTPYFADSNDVNASYRQLIDAQKVDINITNKSRIYERLLNSHNCWSGNCATDAATMLAAIDAWSQNVGAPQPINPALVTSKALKLTEGLVSSGGIRFEQYLIAKYEFQAGSGNVIKDLSTKIPKVDLQLFGNYEWLDGWGITFKSGNGNLSHGYAKSQKIEDTKKIHDLIVPNNQYSIEAWVIPANVSQGDADPAMIFSYGAGANNRNFGVGQKEYQYAFFNRVSTANGGPAILSFGEALQSALQHIVLTYDPTNGRKFYVNGQQIIDPDINGQNEIGVLPQWDLSYLLSLGGDTDNSNPWLGTIRMLAIHNRALDLGQVEDNFAAGVGQKFNLLFSLSEIPQANLPANSYMWFEVSQYDNASYLFTNAKYVIISDLMPSAFTFSFSKMRIGINGREPAVGQAYARLENVNIDSAAMSLDNNGKNPSMPISIIGTVISKDLGVQIDQFFLTFERIDGANNVRTDNSSIILTYDYDANNTKPYVVGMRTFEEIHTTMSQLTGVPKSAVNTTYLEVKQALPVIEDVGTFLSSHQMAITSLALAYCTALTDGSNITARNNFFTDTTVFDSDPPPDTVGDVGTARATMTAIATDIYNKIVTPGLDGFQPALADVVSELTNTDTNNLGLYERLDHSCTDANGTTIPCTQKTRELISAMCMGALGSAAVSMQ